MVVYLLMLTEKTISLLTKNYLIQKYPMALTAIAICLKNRYNSMIRTLIYVLIARVLKCVSEFPRTNSMQIFMHLLQPIKILFNPRINYTVIIKGTMRIRISVIIILWVSHRKNKLSLIPQLLQEMFVLITIRNKLCKIKSAVINVDILNHTHISIKWIK